MTTISLIIRARLRAIFPAALFLSGVLFPFYPAVSTVSLYELDELEGNYTPGAFNFISSGGRQASWIIPYFDNSVSSILMEIQGDIISPTYSINDNSTITFPINYNGGFSFNAPTHNGLGWGIDLGTSSLSATFGGISYEYDIRNGRYYMGWIYRPEFNYVLSEVFGEASTVFYLTSTFGDPRFPRLLDPGHVSVQTARLTISDTEVFSFSPFGLGPVSSVPETSTWAMMLLGFTSVGTILRRSRQHHIKAAI